MTPENFCYWLQGWIEIGYESDASVPQTAIIKNHVALVMADEPRLPGMATEFVESLDTMFKFIRPDRLDQPILDAIKTNLSSIFIHEIDTPDPTGVLQSLHDGPNHLTPDQIANLPYWDKRSPNYDPKARC